MNVFDPSEHGEAGNQLAALRAEVRALRPSVLVGTSGRGEITLKFSDVTAYARYRPRTDDWKLSLRQRGGRYWRGVERAEFAKRSEVVDLVKEATE